MPITITNSDGPIRNFRRSPRLFLVGESFVGDTFSGDTLCVEDSVRGDMVMVMMGERCYIIQLCSALAFAATTSSVINGARRSHDRRREVGA